MILGPYGGLGGWAEGMWMFGLAEVGIDLDPWACATRTIAANVARIEALEAQRHGEVA